MMTLAPAILILAAGKGTRMKSSIPKVMQPLLGQPLLGHVYRAIESAFGTNAPDVPVAAIIGHGAK
ncbi:MAG: NTP transferase domain-containing protein, partial [Bdellovibrionota bacterium]